MSWNEPGGGGNKPRDPWSGNDQGPPDLDEALKKLQQRINRMFGGSGGSGGAGALFNNHIAIIIKISAHQKR